MALQEPLATDTNKQKRGPQTRAIPSFNRVKCPVFLWLGATSRSQHVIQAKALAQQGFEALDNA